MTPDSVPAWASLGLVILVQTAVFAFWAGRLSQRVKGLEDHQSDSGGLTEKVTRLEVQMETANKTLERMDVHIQAAQRQLANIATNYLTADPVPRRRRARPDEE